MNERVISLLIYIAKCVTGTLIVYTLATVLHFRDFGWCLISVILILSADGKDSFQLAITRIKANIVGASMGLVCLLISATSMWTLSIGLALTLSLCYIFKLDSGIRSALAATIIIMLHEEGKHIWDSALQRVIGVLAGCFLGLLITFVFHFKRKITKRIDIDQHQE